MRWKLSQIVKSIFGSNLPHNKSRKPIKSVDIGLAVTVISLVLGGIVMVYNSSVSIAVRDFSDQYYFVKEQLRGLALGLVLFSFFSFVDYRNWRKIVLPLIVIIFILLILVFIPGIGIKALGAHRWIKILGIVIQPAELAKLSLILYLAAWLSHIEKSKFFSFIILMGIFVGLVMIEPDMGTSIILVSIALVMYFCAGSPLWHNLILLPITGVTVAILAIISPYRFSRLLSFLDPNQDPLGASYQIKQALLAIGSGGLFGVGLGMSRQKYEYLPEANTDSIFAVISEETGFIGAFLLILLFLFIIWRGIRIARSAPDMFGRLLAIGITSWIGIQAGLNVSAMLALMPLTGIPLPFISYGSSSLVILLAAVGILLNISRHMSDN